MHIYITSLDKTTSFLNINKIILPTINGNLSILNNHTALITALEIGILAIKSNKKWLCFIIRGGFVSIKRNKINLLAHNIKNITSINISETQKNLEKAILKVKESKTKKEQLDAIIKLKIATAYLEATHYLL
uniref:ATP synthase CF1 epsilon subunit n=1 Tax=Nitzschia alba TaxID=2858 RepID=A0A5C0F2K6_NITAL|nr:ATP synthase CF1 epsilon subunit [Nitzschia alba]QEI59584.1 ATP synthase CF1 epsilon subunit [Nitzschia alba]